MGKDQPTPVNLNINRHGRAEIDLHGFHPHDEDLTGAIMSGVAEAYQSGLPTLTIIHGHGFNRDNYVARFVNSNTGWLGQNVRRILRTESNLRKWMFAKFDCSDIGSTTVRLRRPSR